jgi:hypothetical protein
MERLTIWEIFQENIDHKDKQFVNDYLSVLQLRRTFPATLINESITITAIETIVALRHYKFFKTDTDCRSDPTMVIILASLFVYTV